MARPKKATKKTEKPKTILRSKSPKTIRIACEGAALIDINDLSDFQGTLKTLNGEAYNRLRMSILELGFSFPIHAWKTKDKTYILDAHQRVATLKRMRDDDGYLIPPLPVVWIKAANKKEAAKKLLAATSQYGEVTYSGLDEFLKTFEIDVKKLDSTFQFPEINLDRFETTFYPSELETEEKEVSFTVNTNQNKQKQFILEVSLPSEKELKKVHDDLTNKGFIVRVL